MMKKIFLSLALVVTNLWATEYQAELWMIKNEGAVGDINQVLGVAECVHQSSSKINVKSFQNTEIDKIKSSLQSSGLPVVLLVAGDKGINLLQQLSEVPQRKLFICHASHQIFDNHSVSLEKASLCFLPKHVLGNTQLLYQKLNVESYLNKIVPVIGVAHNVTKELIKEDYARYKDEFNNIPAKVAMIVLAGDAPTSSGVMKYFTQKEAEGLADYLNRMLSKEYTLLVFNGPRTGKHVEQDGKWVVDDKAHKNNETDHVTKAFINKLKVPYRLYDFQFGKPSLYKAAMHLMRDSGIAWVPGESTSMISEFLDNVSPSQTIIYENEAMNENHHAHVKSEMEAGRVGKVLTQELEEIVSSSKSQSKSKSAAAIAAEAILQLLKENKILS